MSKVSALDVISALQILSQTALTAEKIQQMMDKEDLTEAEVNQILNDTDSTIDRLKNED